MPVDCSFAPERGRLSIAGGTDPKVPRGDLGRPGVLIAAPRYRLSWSSKATNQSQLMGIREADSWWTSLESSSSVSLLA